MVDSIDTMSWYSHHRQCAQVRPVLRSWTPCRHGDRNCPRAGSRTTCVGDAAPGNGSLASGCRPWPSWRSITAWPGTLSSRHYVASLMTAWSRSCRTGERSGRGNRSSGRGTRGASDGRVVLGGRGDSGSTSTLSTRLQMCNPMTLRLPDLGSQTGSQRRQTPSDTGRRPAMIGAARWPVRRHPATVRHVSIAPEKRKVDSSILSLTTTDRYG
jgi:hypothetical protein